MPYKFSPSSLSLLKECPRCFWLHFNKGIKRPSTIFPSLPGGMDRVLKIYFDSFLNSGKLPSEIRKEDVELYSDTAKLEEWRSVMRGLRYTDERGNLLRGAIDTILKKGEKLIVLDFKTRGHPVKDSTVAYYQDQLDLYNFLLRKNGYDTEDFSYLLFYHPSEVHENGSFIFHSDLIEIPVHIDNAERILAKALDVLSNPIPEATDCGFCKWIKDNKDFSAQKTLF